MAFKEFIQKNIRPFYHHALRNSHDLRTIFFELTHKCNISCLHCGSDCVYDPNTDDLSETAVLKTLQEIKSKYNSHNITVILSGGEPLCYPGVFKLGKKIYDLEFPWGMVTNGYGWNKKKIRLARDSGLKSISVSLDGLEEEHNWLRGDKDSFKNAVNTIKMLVNNPFYNVMDIITCVNKRNINKLDELYKFIKRLGVKDWRFFLISPIGRATDNPDLHLNSQEFKLLLEKVKEFKSRNEMSVNYSESGYLGCEYENKVREHSFFCMAGISVAGIMVNGDILACPNIDRRFKQGNILRDSFMDIWENKYKEFRNRKWMKTDKCTSCSEWKHCNGNSFHLWDIDNNKTKLCHYNLLKNDSQ